MTPGQEQWNVLCVILRFWKVSFVPSRYITMSSCQRSGAILRLAAFRHICHMAAMSFVALKCSVHSSCLLLKFGLFIWAASTVWTLLYYRARQFSFTSSLVWNEKKGLLNQILQNWLLSLLVQTCRHHSDTWIHQQQLTLMLCLTWGVCTLIWLISPLTWTLHRIPREWAMIQLHGDIKVQPGLEGTDEHEPQSYAGLFQAALSLRESVGLCMNTRPRAQLSIYRSYF